MMGDGVKQLLAKPIQVADQVTKLADDAHSFWVECQELKGKTERLSVLLRQAAQVELYERAARRIMDGTEQVLDKALALVAKCRANGFLKRMFTKIPNPTVSFRKMSIGLDNSIGNVFWLLHVSAAGDMDISFPPIALDEPILFFIWEQIATLHTGSLDARANATANIVSLAHPNGRYGKLIIEEGGVGPLLRLFKEGCLEGQEKAAWAIGLLGRDPESVEQMVLAGVCSVFSKVLKESPMKVQSKVAWAVSELAANHPKCQDVFAQNNVVRLLVGHLAFETVQEHSKYTILPKVTSIHGVVMANNAPTNIIADTSIDSSEHPVERHSMGSHDMNLMHNGVQSTMASKLTPISSNAGSDHQYPTHPANGRQPHISLAGASIKGREFEDPATKAYMKAMAARALWKLSKGNSAICKSIMESKALICFAVLLAKGEKEVQYNTAMAVMEIARVIEVDADLWCSAFKPVVDQLVRIIEEADFDDLLVPCISAIGCLSRIFSGTETRIIGPLVRLLDEQDGVVTREAAIALAKFSCNDNYLHLHHSKEIIKAGGVKHLVKLVYFSKQAVQIAALILLSYIALHVPESEELAQAEVLRVLEWVSKKASVIQEPEIDVLLPKAKGRLELYQSRSSRGYH